MHWFLVLLQAMWLESMTFWVLIVCFLSWIFDLLKLTLLCINLYYTARGDCFMEVCHPFRTQMSYCAYIYLVFTWHLVSASSAIKLKTFYFDLPAVRVWILYCQFMMDIMEGEDSLQGVRSTFEKAIIAAGLHVTEVRLLIHVFYLGDLNL